MNPKLKALIIGFGIIMSILVSGCVEKPSQNGVSVNTSLSPAPFFPVQKNDSNGLVMDALLSSKPEELEQVDGCRRAGGYLLVWPYGFSLSTKDGVIQIIDATGKPVTRVGDKLKVGGGEMPSEIVAKYSAELPSARCSGPYWIVGEVLTSD